MEADSAAKRDEIQKLVTDLMNEKKGEKIRKNAIDWKNKVEGACTDPFGSSMVNLEKVIKWSRCPKKCSSWQALGAGDLEVATPRALVYAGVMTSTRMLYHGV
ncbi:hypothetical protein Tco_0889888 [Tanacetum coccineum]